MRPRHKTAENIVLFVFPLLLRLASMRPRHKTAENFFPGKNTPEKSDSFNEAAAQNRGKPPISEGGAPFDPELQ